MNFKKFAVIGAFAIASTALMNAAHANESTMYNQTSTPAVESTISQEDVGNFFKGVWSKTTDVVSSVGDVAADGAKFVGKNVGEGLEVTGQKLQDISKSEVKSETPKTTKVETQKPTKVDKTAKKVKVEPVAEKVEKVEPKVEKAEFQGIEGKDLVKAKDAVIDGISGFLGKLRSSEQTNETAPKPR